MVTNYGGTGDLMCSSTDVKPTDVAVNTRCLELDTGKFWYFNGTSWTETPGGGGGGSATLIEKSITANGTYTASSDNADGYSSVEVDVPNTYTVDDNGKVVSNQTLVAQTAKPDTIAVNDTYNTTEYNSVTVNVPNSYTAEDEGKVVSGGDLVAQTAYPTEITVNDTYDTTNYNSVTINVPTGGGSVTKNDVNFYDYDGTIVQSYSKTDFLALTSLPANPTHTGLTAQGWNWTLADAKTYVTANGKLDVGQNYVTDDGKTRLYIHLEDGRLSPALCMFANNVSGGSYATVDWGDGSATEQIGGTGGVQVRTPHTYSNTGDYIITIDVVSGSFTLGGLKVYFSILTGMDDSNTSPTRAYKNSLIKCEFGTGIVNIDAQAFYQCYSLESITIPSGVTSIGVYAFYGCYSLKSITIPSGVTRISDYAFSDCYSLTSVEIPSTVTSIGQHAFEGCYSLISISIPSTVTSIAQYAFQNCRSLESITIPSGVTTIGNNAFYSCYTLTSITIPSGVTSISDYAFSDCYSLTSVEIPSTVTSINMYAFYGCYSLKSITIPSGVTRIGDGTFRDCYSLTSIEIPSTVTNIAGLTFRNCYSLAYIDIDRPTGSISGSPWDANTSSPTSTQIIWHD